MYVQTIRAEATAIQPDFIGFQKQLPGFLRISKSVLVNPAHVVQCIKTGKVLHLRMTDNTLLLVARRRITETLAALDSVSNR